MFDLHRHDHFSLFDGFGKAEENAKHAKKLGYTALGLANHGNVSGLIEHYVACKDVGIKPILGVEAYFQPVWNKEKPRYHLCIFVKDIEGYGNLNRLMRVAEEQMYYKPIVTFKDLQKFRSGLIVTSACIGGPIANLLSKGKNKSAKKAAIKFKEIFGDDFYIELQPYKLSTPGLQEQVNIKLAKLAEELNIKCILTSDSHYAKKEDWPTYLKMHEISSPEFDAEVTYGERYMPTEKELIDRFLNMHSLNEYHIFEPDKFVKQCIKNLQEIEDKIDGEVLDKLELKLPEFVEGKSSFDLLLKNVKQGLKRRGKNTKKYIQRCKQELEVIKGHGFSDYFLIVADYVNWAKEQGIAVGPGRGSVCNSQVAWALGITDVDSLYFGLDFRRFLRHDKKGLPDIDLDFETSRRYEVIDYIVEKYKGHAAQIRSYGLYQVDNLVNDLAKVCEVDDTDEIKYIKTIIKKHIEDGILNVEGLENEKRYDELNDEYDNILIHFVKMYKKIKYLGTHAAGVAITGGRIEDYTALKPDKKTGKVFTAFDLADLEKINVIKFDILGLSTMEQIGQLRKLTGKEIEESWFEDENLFKQFREGNTDGVFQFEKATAKQILKDIECDCFEDVIAASSMNRPGPLSLGMPAMYAENKFNIDEAKSSKYWEYTKSTYGTIIYQEQIQQICVNIGNMEWTDADKVMKILKGGSMTDEGLRRFERDKNNLKKLFVKGAISNGFSKKEASELFEMMVVYSFNKGHGTGYSIISLEEMYYKTYCPIEYWFIKCKYAPNDADLFKYKANAVANDAILFIPHVNYSAEYTLREIDGEKVIQEGLSSIKFVGEKAAAFIEQERIKNGNYKSIDDFLERCQVKKSGVNKRVIEQLLANGALEFNKKTYLNRVTKYNSTLYMKGVNTR